MAVISFFKGSRECWGLGDLVSKVVSTLIVANYKQ